MSNYKIFYFLGFTTIFTISLLIISSVFDIQPAPNSNSKVLIADGNGGNGHGFWGGRGNNGNGHGFFGRGNNGHGFFGRGNNGHGFWGGNGNGHGFFGRGNYGHGGG